MADISLQLELISDAPIASGSNVLFDNLVLSNGNIAYNGTTGVITINEPGRYLINWWVATQASASVIGAVFALVI